MNPSMDVELYEKFYVTCTEVQYYGICTLKSPLDLWMYQEIIYKTRPQLIIETGTFAGGSALYMAHILDNMSKEFQDMASAIVITIDLPNLVYLDDRTNQKLSLATHPRLYRRLQNSIDPECPSAISRFMAAIGPIKPERIMVVLDSNHTADHVAKELDIYSSFVTPGCYLIVEDTNLNGHPIRYDFGSGPYEAVQNWLPKHPEFEHDLECERFIYTNNPSGYLKRKG